MKFSTLINSTIIAVVAVLLVTLAFRVRMGSSADSIAVLKTTGMTCGSCSNKITKALEKQAGVAATEVDVNSGWVIVGYDSKTVTPEVLAEKVKGAGFGSIVQQVLTPNQFKKITGRDMDIGNNGSPGGCGGCGKSRTCGSKTQS
jgi:copper chaperone CopZ